MYNGTVTFTALIRGAQGVKFSPLEFQPLEATVSKIEIEAALDDMVSPARNWITTTVHLSGVASVSEARALALKVATAALHRIAFVYCVSIDAPHWTNEQFGPSHPTSGFAMLTGSAVYVLQGIMTPVPERQADEVRAALQSKDQRVEDIIAMFASALRSESQVEEFMHLYQILLMLCDDEQAEVDEWIRGADPSVEQTAKPPIKRRHKKPVIEETVYTKLRNELGHQRDNVDVNQTKQAMSARIREWRRLVKRAIDEKTSAQSARE